WMVLSACFWIGMISTETHGQQVLEAVADVWIRQSATDTTYDDDSISVWSSVASFGGIRYGLVAFDVSSLTGQVATDVRLELFVTSGGSQSTVPINQTVSIVPGPVSGATWAGYHASQ